MQFLFWCEFPERVDFKKLNTFFKEHNFVARVGIVVTHHKLPPSYSHIKFVRAWPTLPKEKGYWFSAFTQKKDIDSLLYYKGIPIKIDIEPPIPLVKDYKSSQIMLFFWFFKMLFIKGKNAPYLCQKIKELSKTTDIMLSTFPFPLFFLKRLGMPLTKRCSYNYIYYTSFVPSFLKPLFREYMRWFIKRRLRFDKNTHFAVGLLAGGIFKNEPCYKNSEELHKDIHFLKKQGVKNIVIFRLGAFQELAFPTKWVQIIK